MLETDCAYLAALIDGEGCTTIAWQNLKGYLIARPIIKIALKKTPKTIALINYLKNTFNGTANIYKNRSNWSLSAYSCMEEVIPRILPYLKIKGEATALLLEAVSILKYEQRGMYLPHTRETLIQVAEISGKIDNLKESEGLGREKWNPDKIIAYVNSSKYYTKEHREKILKTILETQKSNAESLKRYREQPETPEIKEKRIKAIRAASKKRAREKYPDSLVQECHRLYKQGLTVKEISDKLQISYYSVWDWVKRGKRKWSLLS